ncbi:Histidinol dehydrogenase [Galdieria sulphuraria]|nr:Histidinol dehydrogenase [Galdieria sulphuraria]
MSSTIPIYTTKQAEETILRRSSLQEPELSPRVQQRIKQLFGEDLTALQVVQRILESVRKNGDSACQHWTKVLDGVDTGDSFQVSKERILSCVKRIDSQVLDSLRISRDRVLHFHRKQPITSWFTTELGGQLGQLIRPIEKVGFYVPGGSAPLPSSVIMSVCPAVAAGCQTLLVVSPPDKQGSIADVTLAACGVMMELGIDLRVFAIGGAQAIGALAYGTESIPKVDKIVGPGNIFVSLAKKEVFGIVGIDGIYGPTEAVIIADDTGRADYIAADLLAQAEHDEMAVPILLTCSKELAEKVVQSIMQQVSSLSRSSTALHSLQHHGGIVVTCSLEECFRLSNQFAAEHVSLNIKDPWESLHYITSGGGVFVGDASCEVLGDYVAGPSHVMPTGGSARYSSPLNVLDFVKIISLVGLDHHTSMDMAKKAAIIAKSEGLTAHAEAAHKRLNL